MKKPTFIIDTEDTRMFYTLRYIREKGFDTLSLDNYDNKKPAIYCYSPSKRFCCDELSAICNDSIMIAGALPSDQAAILISKNISYHNIILDEVFAVENCIQTAEAALMLLIRATNISIYDMNISVLGFGRLGKAVTNLLDRIGVNVAVHTSDYYERAAAHMTKCSVHDLNSSISDADVIINTIPAKVLSQEKLMNAKKSSYILDLASYSSVDNCDISALGLSYDNALGLPGKHSPKSAGRILTDAIMRIDEVRLCL